MSNESHFSSAKIKGTITVLITVFVGKSAEYIGNYRFLREILHKGKTKFY